MSQACNFPVIPAKILFFLILRMAYWIIQHLITSALVHQNFYAEGGFQYPWTVSDAWS